MIKKENETNGRSKETHFPIFNSKTNFLKFPPSMDPSGANYNPYNAEELLEKRSFQTCWSKAEWRKQETEDCGKSGEES